MRRRTAEELIFIVCFLIVAAWVAWWMRAPMRELERLARQEATCAGLHGQIPQLYWSAERGMCLWRGFEEVAIGHTN